MDKFVPHKIDSEGSFESDLLGDVKAGFPSPAEDIREKLDLIKLLVRHKASTFFFRVSGVSMVDAAMDEGDIIIVGEPSGGKPCHYGDVLYAQLPNTNTLATLSHKYFRRPNMALENKECIVLDVSIELNHPKRDLVWEWIVENYGKCRK